MVEPGLLLHGSVRDQADVPIEDARIWILSGPVACTDIAMLTDSQGEFLISVPATGKYEIACVADGYQLLRQLAEVSADKVMFMSFRPQKAV